MDVHALRDVVARKEPAFIADLEAMVNVDCGSYTPDGVNAIADRCEARFREGGWDVERRSHRSEGGMPRLGDLVVGRLRGDGGARVLLIGHTDTVFDPGTAAARPFRIEGARAYGPGVSDMKGGLVAGFVAVEALREVGFGGFGTITYVCNPDEEIGSPFSGPVIRELAPAHDAAFVLECGRASGDLVSARKGITDYVATFRGRAAHAGVEPEKGRHAVLAAAHATVALQALNGRWPGVTVNVGVARGGTRPNVVPERADLEIDLRAVTAAAQAEAEREVERILATSAIPDVRIDVRSEGTHRPMEKTEGTARLAELAATIAGELGFTVGDTSTGGASDGNTTSAAGTPTLDGLGPVGGGAHAEDEWLDLASVVPRITLLAVLIARV
jgi:glutamate carboxypeptidase